MLSDTGTTSASCVQTCWLGRVDYMSVSTDHHAGKTAESIHS